jgi:hypothetical protein
MKEQIMHWMWRVVPAILVALPVAAQGPGGGNLPEGWDIPVIAPLAEGETALDPAQLDISGAWIYTTSNHMLLACDFPAPPGTDMSGHMEIAEHDGGVTVTLVTGATCDPGSMCIYEGNIVGSVLAVSNTDTVDDEGGVASNGWSMIFTAPDAGVGSGTSVYVHPEGYRCSWGYGISVRRPIEGELD